MPRARVERRGGRAARPSCSPRTRLDPSRRRFERETDMTEYAVTDPRTGERVSDVPTDTDEQVLAAVATAHQTFNTWGRTSSVADRAALVQKVADLHTERREALASAMNREMGKAMDDALGEVDFSASIYAYYADHAEQFLADEPIDLLDGE